MNITVDHDGLGADGAGLLSSSVPPAAPPTAQPAAGDSVSVELAEVFNQWSATLWSLLEHAAPQRQAGGVSVGGTAQTLLAVDDHNGAAIASLGAGARAPQAPDIALPTNALPDVSPPTLPTIPTLSPPPPLTGEQIANLVHQGPGPDSLRTLAQALRGWVAPYVSATADDTRRYATAINEHWDDGRQGAGANTLDHAEWLTTTIHPQVTALADRVDESASHADTLIQQTPRPEEFTDLHRRLTAAVADYRAGGGINPGPVMALSTQLAKKQSTAVEAFHAHYASATTTTGSAPPPPNPAPPIVAGPPAKKLEPKPGEPDQQPKDDENGDGFGGKEHGKGPGGKAPDGVPGDAVATPGAARAGPPQGQPLAPAMATAPGVAANIAGTLVGAGTGALGQLTGGLPSAAGSPLSALSGLSSLPGLGGGAQGMQMPEMPSGPGDSGHPASHPGSGQNFGTGDTTPASGGGADMAGAGPMASASPAVDGSPVAPTSPAVGVFGGGSSTPPTGAAAGGGMGGMYPPMMVGRGKDGGERDKTLNPDRRVVLRPVPNTEPVFGELERKRSSGVRRRTQDEEEP
jgi:hypothetical protein